MVLGISNSMSSWWNGSWSGAGAMGPSQLGVLIDAVELQFETSALSGIFGGSGSSLKYPVLGASIAGAISQAGLNGLYGNLMDAPLTGQTLADALLYGPGIGSALGAAWMLNSGSVVDLLG